jgi:hypothetical protein
MSKRTKALTRELHDKGLRTRLARRAAEAVEASDGAPTDELREIVEVLRGLASELEGHVTSAEAPAPQPAAAAQSAPARKPAARKPAARKPPSAQRVKPRARRN